LLKIYLPDKDIKNLKIEKTCAERKEHLFLKISLIVSKRKRGMAICGSTAFLVKQNNGRSKARLLGICRYFVLTG